jgi:tryptophan-rich sensory protein
VTAAAGRRSWRAALALAGFLLATLAVAQLGRIASAPEIGGWYAGLAKPSFNPPDGAFAPVWITLYVLMAIAAWLVWRAPVDEAARRGALGAWWIQLGLNLAWSWIFFAAKDLAWAFVDIVALLGAIGFTIWRFAAISRGAAWLLAPYLAWVGFAALLNFSVWRLNAPA